MAKQEFKAESKRLLDLMINSIYTNRDIFLRELISNASDAIDKVYYKTLADENKNFNKEDYYIQISVDKANRTITVEDTGIGMNKSDMEDNLGIIAKSGSLQFKKDNEIKDGFDIIGQFGVGFYSAFMVAKKVKVLSKSIDDDKAYLWESEGIDGYEISESEKSSNGTIITIYLKDNTDEEKYDEYLEEYKLRSLVKKYSDFIRYPIKMEVTKSRPKEDDKDNYEDYIEIETLNSMVPIWRKNKNELTEEDYINFYNEKHYGFDKPLKYIHTSADGVIRYTSIMYIPSMLPFNYYSKEFKKGLELYSNGVLIMDKCSELLPDYFGFVVGMVDSEDLSLNISRETLQHDRQLKLIAKRLNEKIKNELTNMLKNKREDYDKFYDTFSRSLKFGIYDNWGMNKDELQDLIMFKSSLDKEKYTTLEEYVSRMKDDQKEIYYATGESVEKIEKMPQTEFLLDKGYEILYFTDEVDEFAIQVLRTYKEKEFKSVSSSDINVDNTEKEKNEEKAKESKSMLDEMKEILKSNISDVVISNRLKSYPVCISAKGSVSVEMEKTLNAMPTDTHVKAEKVLEINPENKSFDNLKKYYEQDKDKFTKLTEVLYNQALLIEGLQVQDPIKFANNISDLLFG
ncbi:chaperone protein HtpG [Peptoanaerobacter stomatis]|uniref:Chaperone protein HtpG n=1 Tax=Peptoanaerobacter stomatis TaxID=796937 RepID=J5UFS4_9FIRM|nr:molecular chaperone HtpG [Peptoanaerobacter stomatis]EJU22179.1 chaperone protein HtpG [Peptoanaerobacter stomatis]NWO24940.1 molecular chaperone HtpG [Peptostreptococcaceae bacterium oral taxon 081]